MNNGMKNRPDNSQPPIIELGPRRGGGPMSARVNAAASPTD